jgi:hypothetical protein
MHQGRWTAWQAITSHGPGRWSVKILTSGTEGIAVCLGVRPAQSGLLIGTEAPPSLAAG